MRQTKYEVIDQTVKISGALLNAHDWHLSNSGFPEVGAGAFVKMILSESL